MALDFVGLDFETANGKRASVCQIGVTSVRNGEIRKTFSDYVTPPPGFETFASRNIEVHKITSNMVIGAPTWGQTLEKLVRFAGNRPIIAHNAPFEKSVVSSATAAVGATVPQFTYYCTLKLARKMLPGHESYSLGPLLAAIGLDAFDHHDAGADAEASARLALHIAQLRGIDDVHTLFA